MGGYLLRAVKRLIKSLGYAAAYFADVPAFLQWAADQIASVAALAASEPIGTLALVISIAVAIAVAWLAVKDKPPIF